VFTVKYLKPNDSFQALTLPCGSRVSNVALGNVTWSDVIGSVVWLAGVHIQHDSLKTLAKLRTDSKKKSKTQSSLNHISFFQREN